MLPSFLEWFGDLSDFSGRSRCRVDNSGEGGRQNNGQGTDLASFQVRYFVVCFRAVASFGTAQDFEAHCHAARAMRLPSCPYCPNRLQCVQEKGD